MDYELKSEIKPHCFVNIRFYIKKKTEIVHEIVYEIPHKIVKRFPRLEINEIESASRKKATALILQIHTTTKILYACEFAVAAVHAN